MRAFKRVRRSKVGVLSALALSGALLATSGAGVLGDTGAATAADEVRTFQRVTSMSVPDGIAEILSTNASGSRIVYSNASAGEVGIVDITDPSQPELLSQVPVDGEPTSVTVVGESLALAAVRRDVLEEGAAPELVDGALVAIDVESGEIIGEVAIGHHPDSISAMTDADGTVHVVIAIENEPVVVDADGNLTDVEEPGDPGDISGPGYVQVVTFASDNFAGAEVSDVELSAAQLDAAGLYFADDPQPEFVDIDTRNGIAAVSLQENNGYLMLDVAGGKVLNVISAGVVADRPADLDDNDEIDFSDVYPADVADEPYAGARFPDAVAWSADGETLYSADEGEFDLSGGRGWSTWLADGTFVRDDAGTVEAMAVQFGHYPDGRSDAKGVEMEGVETGVFHGREFVFVGSERGSFVAVYEREGVRGTRFVQLLPTGVAPEGLLAIPSRDLFVTSEEDTGSLTFFAGSANPVAAGTEQEPQLRSGSVDEPWAALSGLGSSAYLHDTLYAVPDNAAPSAIYRITVGAEGPGTALVRTQAAVTIDGEQASYDLEGITRDTSIAASGYGGWWLASEGNGAFGEEDYVPNLLVQVDVRGRVLQEVQLPAEFDRPSSGIVGSNGFEGLAVSSDGGAILVAMQREFPDDESPNETTYTRIGRYDLATGAWSFYLYPLDAAGEGWVGLSEIVSLGGGTYAVIERDNQFGGLAETKKVYMFTLDGVAATEGNLTADTDLAGAVIEKVELTDLLDEFAPFEKIEGLTVDVAGDVWAALDNDGGDFGSRLINLGSLSDLLAGSEE